MSEQTQVCNKCFKEFPLSYFGKQPRMKNGHSKQCKGCIYEATKQRRALNRLDPVLLERQRRIIREDGRKHRAKYKDTMTEQKKQSTLKSRQRYPEKHLARRACQRLPMSKGFSNHHWSYCEEHRKGVIVLTTAQHFLAHRFMVYDQERMMYRRMDGSLIDSREAAIAYYATLKD